MNDAHPEKLWNCGDSICGDTQNPDADRADPALAKISEQEGWTRHRILPASTSLWLKSKLLPSHWWGTLQSTHVLLLSWVLPASSGTPECHPACSFWRQPKLLPSTGAQSWPPCENTKPLQLEGCIRLSVKQVTCYQPVTTTHLPPAPSEHHQCLPAQRISPLEVFKPCPGLAAGHSCFIVWNLGRQRLRPTQV